MGYAENNFSSKSVLCVLLESSHIKDRDKLAIVL